MRGDTEVPFSSRSGDAGYKIIHIAPHFGGGVGSVVLNYLAREKENVHVAACWDVAKADTVNSFASIGIPLYSAMANKPEELLQLIQEADIVLLHFWNHPLGYWFLVNNPLPPARVVIWAHTAGRYPPYVYPTKLLEYADRFVYTAASSLDVEEAKNFRDPEKLSVIVSTSGIERFADIQHIPHTGFVIGYIGTVDHAKLHRDYVDMCSQVARIVPEARFVVISGDSQEELKRDVMRAGLGNKVNFLGKVDDVAAHIAGFDVLGYPLMSKHFGTGEQVLQESMAAGVVPVVLDNPTETAIVQEFGVVARDTDDYIAKIVDLWLDREKLRSMGIKAREFALRKYTFAVLCDRWQKLFEKVMEYPRREREWFVDTTPVSPYSVFLESLGRHAGLFTAPEPELGENIRRLADSPEWMSKSKGTPYQYAAFFPRDHKLADICKRLTIERRDHSNAYRSLPL